MSALGKSSAFAALGFLLLSFSCRGEDNAPYVYGAEMCTALRKPSVALSVISCHLADSSVLDYSTIPGCSEAATNLAFLHSCYCNFFLGPYTTCLKPACHGNQFEQFTSSVWAEKCVSNPNSHGPVSAPPTVTFGRPHPTTFILTAPTLISQGPLSTTSTSSFTSSSSFSSSSSSASSSPFSSSSPSNSTTAAATLTSNSPPPTTSTSTAFACRADIPALGRAAGAGAVMLAFAL